MLDLSASTRKSPYFAKDQAKAQRCTKFIGCGSKESSTRAYCIAAGPLANCGLYHEGDVVMVSAEGARRQRRAPDYTEINRAAAANVTFITDVPADRERPYNVGEREVARYLGIRRYVEVSPGVWQRPLHARIVVDDDNWRPSRPRTRKA